MSSRVRAAHLVVSLAAWCAGISVSFAPLRASADEPVAPRVLALAADGSSIDPSHGHLALSREIPRALTRDQLAADESDAIRLVFSDLGSTPGPVQISTYRSNGSLIDTLSTPTLSPQACPDGVHSASCWVTSALRLTPDRLDRDYPVAKSRSLEAALGGELRVEAAGRPLGRWRVGGPRTAAFVSFERLSAKLRVHILRVAPGGAPAVGGDSVAAVNVARAEVAAASKLWAQCGIDLEGRTGPEIEVVDPPPTGLLAIGCDAGLPASGGQLTFDVAGHRLRVASHAGEPPLVVAERLSRALRGLGLRAELSPNQRTSAGASGAVDVLVRSARGVELPISAAGNLPLSTDRTLGVCLGEVDLGNGLAHFVESDASAGTLEERALVKAFDDGDPSTIDVLIVPSFDQSGRIGESFIDDDGSAIQNTVIIDRAAVRAGPRSYALAHEIGHILLDMPGHPDDYGVDQSSSLMDADAADASVFGPRRLSVADCERVLTQSGPSARVPLLQSWPLGERRAPLPATTSVR
jgi:hypothetical protein